MSENQNKDTIKYQITRYLLSKSKELLDLKILEGKTMNDFIDMQLTQLMSPWMLNFIRYNPASMLEKVKCPVLAINGDKDLQVDSNINLQKIKIALKNGGNNDFIVKELPGLNHLFQECKTGSPTEYAGIEQTISPIALETMTSWIKKTLTWTSQNQKGKNSVNTI